MPHEDADHVRMSGKGVTSSSADPGSFLGLNPELGSSALCSGPPKAPVFCKLEWCRRPENLRGPAQHGLFDPQVHLHRHHLDGSAACRFVLRASFSLLSVASEEFEDAVDLRPRAYSEPADMWHLHQACGPCGAYGLGK